MSICITELVDTIHCRFDLGSGAVFIRSQFTAAINTAHIVNASRYARRVNCIVISWYHFIIAFCVEWDKLVDCQWIIDHQLKVPLLVKLLS